MPGFDVVIVPRLDYVARADFAIQVAVASVAGGAPVTKRFVVDKNAWLFGGSFRAALTSPLSGGWGAGSAWQPDRAAELIWVLERELLPELASALEGAAGRLALVVHDGAANRTDLTATVRAKIAAASSGRLDIIGAKELELRCLAPGNRSLAHLDDVLADDAEARELARRLAAEGIGALAILELSQAGNAGFVPELWVARPRGSRLNVRRRTLEAVDLRGLAGAGKPKSLVRYEPSGRFEVFTLLVRAARQGLSTDRAARWLSANPQGKIALLPVETRSQRADRFVFDEFCNRVHERRMALYEVYGSQLDGPDLEQRVLDDARELVIAGKVFPDLRRAETALRELALDLETNAMTMDFEREASRHMADDLRQIPGVGPERFAAGERDLGRADRYREKYSRRQARSGRRAVRTKQTVVQEASLLLVSEFHNSGRYTHATVRLVDLASGLTVAQGSARSLPALTEAAYAEISRTVEQRAPIDFFALFDAKTVDLPTRKPGDVNREDFIEARTGSVAFVRPDPRPGREGYLISRAGTCFAIQIDGRSVLVTNRHVVTKATGAGQWVLSHQTPAARQDRERLFVYFPTPDGKSLGFETRVIGFSRTADFALLEDHRQNQLHFDVASIDALQKGEPLLSCGYPGFPNKVRRMDTEVAVVVGDDGEERQIRLLVTDDPSDAKGMIDVFFVDGVFSSLGKAQPPRSSGRMMFFTCQLWGGNSGGPILTERLEVAGVGTVTFFGGEGDPNLDGGPALSDHLDELRALLQ